MIAFGPLAIFDSKLRYYCSDERWNDVVKRVELFPPEVFHQDLPRLIDSLAIRTRFHVYYGTKPTEDPGDKMRHVEAVNYDAVHGFLYGRCARVEAHPLRWSVHRVPEYLRQVGFIDELMLHRVLGVPYSPESFDDLPVEPGLINWMEINYTMGFDAQVLMPQVRPSNEMTMDVVRTCFSRVRRNVLRPSCDRSVFRLFPRVGHLHDAGVEAGDDVHQVRLLRPSPRGCPCRRTGSRRCRPRGAARRAPRASA